MPTPIKTMGLAVALICGCAATASASFTSDLFVGSTNVGTITVMDNVGGGGGVLVTETLAPNVFAFTGSSNPFEFSLSGNPTLADTSTGVTQGGKTYYAIPSVITGITYTPPVTSFTPMFVFYEPPYAPSNTSMDYGIDCSNCTGTSQGYQTFSFDLASYSASDFVSSGNQKDGIFYFISDVGICSTSSSCSTSAAYATTITQTVPTIGGGGTGIPEPASTALLGSGILGLATLIRGRRGARSAQ